MARRMGASPRLQLGEYKMGVAYPTMEGFLLLL